MHKKINFGEIETKWQQEWERDGLYRTDMQTDKEKLYVLDMFPYPSGEGLHVGHPKGYIATDIYSRFKTMSGYEVLHPMGWDAFGLPAENFAIKHKVHPRVAVEKNIANFKAQLAKLGFNYDWSHEINTTDPEYYKWTQWIFLKLLEKGLAYESFEPINWCPSCQTGLANEDLESDGTCERCDSEVEKRPMRQWILKITEYADRMLADLDTLTAWPEHIKEAQRHWIGKSTGAEIDFELSTGDKVTVFTTRPDTLFGATYLVLAPEHTLVEKLPVTNQAAVQDYVHHTRHQTEQDRLDATREKTGVKLEGITATNPVNGAELPVFIADYVLADYGTGAIMAVPAHDERDGAFAKKFSLPVKTVISDDGELLDSGEFTGMTSADAKDAITKKISGRVTSTYRLNDWVFSRQRYWGEPIPIIHLADGTPVPVAVAQLPVTLPEVEHYAPTGTGESPLADITDWVNVTGYLDESGSFMVAESAPAGQELISGTRETNTMPQWAGSSWYYLRFIDPQNTEALISPELEKQWAPVDVYVGGDHAVRHLIYARFWHKFLYDLGVVHTIEPFTRLEFLGFILAEDGRKMSKRWGNVINPDDVVAQNGADTLRVYEMFMGPFENTIAWNVDSLVGAQRFLERVNGLSEHLTAEENSDTTKLLHKTIAKVRDDIEHFKFNTAVSAMMIFVNAAEKQGLSKANYEVLLKLLAPFAPHLTEELWQQQGHTTSIHRESFPEADHTLTIDDKVKIGVQVNGKLRAEIEIATTATETEAVALANQNPQLTTYLQDIEIVKVIFVPGRILSFITKNS